MSAPIITFFNNKGGVGKTSLVYHIAWMMADLGKRVVVADLDPQANLTTAFLTEDEIERLWSGSGPRLTVWGTIRPFQEGEGGLGASTLTPTGDDRLGLLAGDLDLSAFEDDLSASWPKCLDGDPRAFRIISAFWSVLQNAARQHHAHYVLVDVGPSLGAINRAALVASDFVVIPVAPDLFSMQGLRNLGPALQKWRTGWRQRLHMRPENLALPEGEMAALGYVVLQHGVRLNRPVQAYQRWIRQIPEVFRGSVLGSPDPTVPDIDQDPYCLGQLKHYRSLVPLAQEARKPIFFLTHADGAYGGHLLAARDAHGDFAMMAERIMDRVVEVTQTHPA
ncbi:ParA family protein [Actinokineospora globicatena]|uniref:ParA family protein n=1 Tax=Actinokineospora globicatena TaxID=103729 RepID=UPI0020A507ED|nr:AAA family ATPase [Actinokineospora globicatena]MCP2305435.1 CobQ/CobB/MinD/ParA nucleotide binding domain-containing protein [Actinokineospora globicatena]GLW81303.1 phage-related regulatory protein [Actinokineospora globicatena]GLW87999.1 phage-related regulatory protein [Actinokineospora globicatena]